MFSIQSSIKFIAPLVLLTGVSIYSMNGTLSIISNTKVQSNPVESERISNKIIPVAIDRTDNDIPRHQHYLFLLSENKGDGIDNVTVDSDQTFFSSIAQNYSPILYGHIHMAKTGEYLVT